MEQARTPPQPVRDRVFRRVLRWVRELFENPYVDEETGHVYVRYGSTVLEIAVEPYRDDEAIVVLMAYCVQGVRPEPGLLAALLELNHDLPFGAFSVVDRDVFFSHALFGSTLQRRNLWGAIEAVAEVSDEYDDRIVARFGGQTALDRIRDTGGRERRRKTRP